MNDNENDNENDNDNETRTITGRGNDTYFGVRAARRLSRPSYVRMYDAATLRDGRGKPLHIRDAESTIAASVRDLKRSRFARIGYHPSGAGLDTNESDP